MLIGDNVLLTSSVPQPTSPASVDEPLSPDQRHKILTEWNHTSRDYPLDVPLHHYFEEQVLRTPDLVAVEFEGTQLTYQQLNQRANLLALELIERGIGPDVLVGVYAVRSLEMVVALLAILKASGAYVPIDPEYPADRVAYMLSDAGMPILLTTSALEKQLPPHDADVILLDLFRSNSGAEVANPSHRVDGFNLAYMIYTSGSTGRPKGALNTHRGIVNRLTWMQEQYNLTTADVVLQKTPFSFDVSVWEFFWPLMTGARLCVARPAGHRDPGYLVQLIQERQVTVLHFVPSMLSLFLSSHDVERCTSLRHVICSGEALTADLRDRLFSRLNVRLHNLYGPTEAAVDVTYWTCQPTDAERFVPIGRPIANTHCYILNESLEPVPVGVPAELYLGGVQIGRGYHGQPELTSQKFIPDPFQSDPTARLYKTGDLCRFLPDGNIQFLGRLDNQVKVRGFRIELDEIESVLGNHPGVLRCVVLTEDNSDGDKSLVAYLVPSDASTLSSGALRTWLASQLPDYMIPSRFLALPSLPLTPNGKVDRKALSLLDAVDLSAGTVYREPFTELEKTLAQIWQTVLGRGPIGLDDHFLDLGGHSLRAASICAQISDQLQKIVPPRWIFESPTVAELAKRIEFERDELVATVTIPRIEKRDQLRASPGQRGMWLLQQMLPDSATYNQPYAWRFNGPIDVGRLQRALRQIVTRHETLRSGLNLVNDVVLMTVRPAGNDSLPWTERNKSQLPLMDNDVDFRAILREEARRPFDLTQGPLWRACLFQMADDQCVLFMTLHHSILDEWSIRLLIGEIEALCHSAETHQQTALPDLSVQYADFAAWQASRLASAELQAQSDYWKQQLADLPAPLTIAGEHARPAERSGQGAIHEFRISGDVIPALKQLARDESTTLFAVLLAGFQVCLYRHSGQNDLVIGTPFTNRKYPQVQSLIGYFLNTLPIRNELDPDLSFRHCLRKLNSTLWDAYSHSDFPFEQMVEQFSKDRTPGCHPIFQVLFVLLEEGVGTLRIGDRTGEPFYVHTGTSKVDLTLDIQASGDEWVCRFEYATDLFDVHTIDSLARHFQTLVSSMIQNPDSSLDRLTLFSQSEREELPIQWNETDKPFPSELCIHELFEQQAKRTPDSIALVYQESEWSYRNLNCRANQLAHELRKHGVGPGSLVGLHSERCPELLFGLLAILKAGGAYVPLDPSYPRERLVSILDDAHISVVLCQSHLADSLLDRPVKVIELSNIDTLRRNDDSNLIGSTRPSDLAYVLYTSGSTGKPKGVAMEHGSLVNLIAWQNRLSHPYRTLQFASAGFDVSFQEIFSTWTSGGTLLLTDEATRRDLPLLVETICQTGIERLFVPYVILQQLAELGLARAPGDFSLREVITAGEQLLVTPILRNFFSRLPACRLINQYGPTEAHVVSSYELDPDPARWTLKPSIGGPIDNNRLYVLDANKEPVPTGVAGELYISGQGVARGYLNNPELSSQKFLSDPFPGRDRVRMYRTGDKACWRSDGVIEFLGRLDNQVKIRGFRIELGEIESVLGNHPEVLQSVVLTEGETDKSLAAYLVLAGQSTLTSAELRSWLASRLPEYMIPARFLVLPSLPLTRNGKVNRKELPMLPALELRLGNRFRQPMTSLEIALASIWEKVLGRGPIGLDDHFLDLGGHSLRAASISARISEQLQRIIPPKWLFESPTIAELSQRIESEHEDLSRSVSIPRLQHRDQLQASVGQQGMWLLQQLTPDPATYNQAYTWRFREPIDVSIIERSLTVIAERHEILRSGLVQIDDVLRLKIDLPDAFQLPWSQHSGPELSSDGDDTSLMDLLLEEARRPFDLSRSPLWRVRLFQLSNNDLVLAITFHHSIIDEWSLRRFLSELKLLCSSSQTVLRDSLPAISVQYSDFAAWQRQRLAGPELNPQRDYWKQQLANLPAPLELSETHLRTADQTGRGAIHEFRLNSSITSGLRQLAREESTTVFAVMLAAFQACLYRQTDQSDIVIGTPYANREHPQIQALIGYFLNTLPIRNQLDPLLPFRTALRHLQSTLWDAFSNSEIPFEQMVELAVHERLPGYHPIFQVLFVLLEEGIGPLSLGDIAGEPIDLHTQTSKVDLILDVQAVGDEWICRFEYAVDLFDLDSIDRLSRHFQTLVSTIAHNPDLSLYQLPLLNAAESEQLLVEWNQTDRVLENDVCIHERFEQQVLRTPEAVALVFQQQHWSYRSLNDLANQLAHDLREQGAGPGVLVGLHAERSPELLLGLIAILKSGAAYVPLDPTYPRERLQGIIEDAGISLMICQRNLWTVWQDASVMLIDPSLTDRRADLATSNVPHSSSPDDIAYVLYTSGSTGKPKGVAMEHRAVVNLIEWQNRQSASFRTLQFASVGFDVSFQEIFSTLTSGGSLIMVDDVTRADMALLVDTICQQKIERLFVPFVVLQQLAELGIQRPSEQFSLREVITAGEQLLVTPTLRRFFTRMPQCRLINQYGPTETHVVTAYELDQDPGQWPTTPPIGRPIDNNRIYILDSHLQPVPVGVPGQIYVSGRGVAKGYLNQPKLTSEKFLDDPFPGRRGVRMYRTGDKACWRTQGVIEFLGRIDQQIKFRGFRIEPGEIESVLNTHSYVSQSVVVLREDRPGEKRLVAYLVASNPLQMPSVADLREHLAARLPEYMVPSAFVFLDVIPVTVNGKVDRRLLPVPSRDDSVQSQEYTAPRNQTESTLAQLWQNILGIDRIGVHDNFFELGGHSLMATRVVGRVRSQFGQDLTIRSVFESPTIARMAKTLDSSQGNGDQSDLPILSQAELKGELLPTSFAQERLWFLDQYEQNVVNYNLCLGWRIRGALDRLVLEKSLQKLIERHGPLHTTFVATENGCRQRVHPNPQFSLSFFDLTHWAEVDQLQSAQDVFHDDLNKPFDLAADLMLRGTLVQCAQDDYRLLLVIHHIASDGWSLEILERELAVLYQISNGDAIDSLPDLPIQYSDYAVWQRDRLRGEIFQNELGYWKKQLAGIPDLLELPTDFPRPAVSGFRGARHEFNVDQNLTQALTGFGRAENATLYMTLLAAWQVVLSRYSGQTDIVIGSPVSGRHYSKVENLIGLFVNTLALRTNVTSGLTVRGLLGQVRETTLNAYAHQEIPFEKLVHDLNPPRSLNHSPLFQVMFSLQTGSGSRPTIPGLSLDPLEVDDIGTAKFDLVMVITETETGLKGVLEYDADLFLPETIRRMSLHYESVLEGFISHPDSPVDQLSLLTPAECQLMLSDWNRTRSNAPLEKTVHRVFEDQVLRTPSAVAVEFEDQVLTYSELNRKANQLAHLLHRRGVREDIKVGLCVDRSLDMVIGLLAILKAGGAYVPLDPCYPDERLSYLVSDTGLSLILTQSQLQNRWSGFPVDTLALDSCQSDLARESSENLICKGTGDRLAYLIYTSGSTGQPKGVEVIHRGIVRLVCDPNYVRLDAQQTVLHLAVLSFDASTFEIWGPLLNGGRCVLAPNQLPTAADLGRIIHEKKITTLWLTSTLFNAIVDDQVSALKGLQQLLVGGEALSVPHVRRAQEALGPKTRLINGYGPTECTTFACCYPLPSPIPNDWDSIPIGRPISDTTAYVLDPHGQPVPIGVVGELCLGGDGLARGYLNQPGLTSERFVMSSIEGLPSERIYRTGDLVRWKADGTIEFRGRRDHQVKLRGFRIELGEIETALLQQPIVRQAVVVLREVKPGNKQLVAYIVPAQSNAPSIVREIRQSLKSQLPEYMIPTAFVELAELPRNASGKIDRAALPVPEMKWDLLEESIASTPLEGILIDIWKNILGVERVGKDDNFFELGGHSLMAIRVVDKINQTLHKRMKVLELFSHPTIGRLAQRIEDSGNDIGSTPQRTYLELIHRGHRNSHLVIVGATIRANIDEFPEGTPVWWLKLDGLHVLPHLDLDIRSQAEQFVRELTSTIRHGTIVLCGHSYGGLLAIEIAERLKSMNQYRVELVLLEPSPAWRKSESFLKHLVKKAKALHKPDRIGRIRHLVKSYSHRVVRKLAQSVSTAPQQQPVPSESDESFRRMVPFFMKHMGQYPFPPHFRHDLHLVATPGYIEAHLKDLQSATKGEVTVHGVAGHYSHLDIARPENGHLWVPIVRQLLEEG